MYIKSFSICLDTAFWYLNEILANPLRVSFWVKKHLPGVSGCTKIPTLSCSRTADPLGVHTLPPTTNDSQRHSNLRENPNFDLKLFCHFVTSLFQLETPQKSASDFMSEAAVDQWWSINEPSMNLWWIRVDRLMNHRWSIDQPSMTH